MELSVIETAKADLKGIGTELRLPGPGEKAPDVENQIIRFFGKLGMIESPKAVEFGICAYQRRAFEVERLEQHRLSGELLYAVDEDFLMPVAPNLPGADKPDLEKAFALHIRRGTGVIFAPGAWHWVPYPLKGASFALVGFALDTAKTDMHFHDLVPALKIRR
jgi:ureidoglycolate hydrolase